MARGGLLNEPDLERGIPNNENAEKRAATTATIDERELSMSQGLTGSRRSTEKFQTAELVAVIEEIYKKYREDHPQKDGKKEDESYIQKIRRSPGPIRYAIYILPLWILLAIPLAVTLTVFRNVSLPTDSSLKPSDPGFFYLSGLFIWFEFVALGLWVAKSLSWSSLRVFQHGCDTIRKKYKRSALLLKRLTEVVDDLMDLPVTLIIWAVISYASTSALAWFTDGGIPDNTWAWTLKRALLAGIVVSAIIWVERFLICLSFVSYYSKRYDEKNKALDEDTSQIKRLFVAQTGTGDSTVSRTSDHRLRSSRRDNVTKDWNRDRDSADKVFKWAISKEEHASRLGYYLGYSMNLMEDNDDLKIEEIKNHLPTNDNKDVNLLTDILNGDNDDDVTFIELRTALKRIGRRRETLDKTLRNVSEAMESLDRPLSALVLVAIAFIYAAFFVNNFSTYATAIFTAFTGLGFALSGTVTEFLGACIFLFVKQPYAVGDKCDIKGVQLEVDRISLMTTKFIRVDTGKLVQLSHNILNTLWIENFSRSKRLKENFTVAVSPEIHPRTVELLRDDMASFIEKNHRDFYQDSVKIQLVSISDITKLELEIEIEHKFVYYDDELHSDRSSRFKWALLSFLRHREVLPPGDPVALGDPTRPTFAISSSDLLEKSINKQKLAMEEQKEKNRRLASNNKKELRSGRSSALDL